MAIPEDLLLVHIALHILERCSAISKGATVGQQHAGNDIESVGDDVLIRMERREPEEVLLSLGETKWAMPEKLLQRVISAFRRVLRRSLLSLCVQVCVCVCGDVGSQMTRAKRSRA